MPKFKLFKRSPKATAKRDLKNALKDAQWKADYNKALEDLGVSTTTTRAVDTSSARRYGGISSGAKWPYGLSSSGSTRIIDHYTSRQNVRDLFHESLDARAVIERFANSVIDTGLILESTPQWEILGITSEQAEEWAADVERRFNLWAKDKKQHRAGQLSFYQAQRLYQIMQQRDNDVFVRLYYSPKKDLQSVLQFDFIDANQIRGNAWTSTYAQHSGEDGITRNPDGTEKSYKIWISKPNKPYEYEYKDIPRIGPKSGRLMMIHGFTMEYAGQQRGYPRMAVAIQELENLTDFSAAAIKKAINQSNLVMSVENQQKDPGNPFEGITLDSELSAAGIQVGATSTESETIIENIVTAPTVCPIPEAGLDTPGSVAFVGNEQGDNIKLLETKAPADNFKEFVTVFTERLAAALNIPQEVVLMKFGQNYSASRATLLLAWREFNIWRQEQNTDFHNPVFEMWLSEEISAGRISAPGFSDPTLRAAWLNCQWIGTSIPSIDPAKEAKARKDNLEMNLTTGDRESRNLNGSDFMSNIRRNKKTFPEMAQPPWGKSGTQPTEEIEESEEVDNER